MDNLHTRTYMMRIGQLTEQTTQSTFGLNERSGSIAKERRMVTNQRQIPMDALLGNTMNSYKTQTVTLNFNTREELFWLIMGLQFAKPKYSNAHLSDGK